VYGEMTQSGLSGGYVTNHNAESGATDADVLISFGLKYDEFNLDLPIVTIQVNNAHRITLYSNKIAYGVNSEYSRWCIPKDGQYHLV
jgi:hypothetical protein